MIRRKPALARILLLVMMALIARPASAAVEESSAKKNLIVGKWAYKRLTKAHNLINKKRYRDALESLDSLMRKKGLNDHERALTWQTYGFVWSSRGNLPKAIKCFERCLELNALAEGAQRDLRFNLGQLYLATKRYKKALELLTSWISQVENPSPHAQHLIAMAYVQNKQHRKALAYAKKAVAGVKKPSESWLQFLLSLHFQLKQHKDVARVLEQLVSRFPRKTYWIQLAAIYSELKQEQRSLAVLEIAYVQKFLDKDSELMNLASLYMHNGIPYKAAMLLEEGIASGVIERNEKSLKLLAESWLHAREIKRALHPLSNAARLSEKGDLYLRLAQIHLKREKWSQAVASLKKALKKKKIKDRGSVYLLMGIANYRLNRYGSAKHAFTKALARENTKDSAKMWLRAMRTRS